MQGRGITETHEGIFRDAGYVHNLECMMVLQVYTMSKILEFYTINVSFIMSIIPQ